MPQSSRTFRIFVSSTFGDLKAERDALQQYVFPRLRDLAMKYGCRFQAIDLRWGVSEEAALDQQTMKICLGEIERCRKISPKPNFLILLGDRFGWRPLPHAVPARELELFIPLLTEKEREKLLWRDEQPEDERGWYRLDDNAIPPEYLLQARQPGTRYEEHAIWESEVEKPLLAALERAAIQVGLDDADLIKYTLSATGQEIFNGAIKTDDSHEHVFGFFRTITNLNEIQGLPQGSSFMEYDQDARKRQEALKCSLNKRLAGNITEYQAIWDGYGISTDHIGLLPDTLEECLKINDNECSPAMLCKAVWLRLSKIILDEVAQLESVDAIELEQQLHDKFGIERSKFFVGRGEYLKCINEYLGSNNAQPLVIWGESGSGKSALMAKAIQLTKDIYKEKITFITRFIGATPESSNVRVLLESIFKQITREYKVEGIALPKEFLKLLQEFSKCLLLATAEKPLVIFLDALNQASYTDNNLNWLPLNLPPYVRLVISTLPGEGLDMLKQKLPDANLMEVRPMSVKDGDIILSLWLEDASRRLRQHQKEEVLSKFSLCGLPLYLKLAFEESRLWKSFDPVTSLPVDIQGIIRAFYNRLMKPENHGEVLVSHGLGYMAAVKNGLSEDEIVDILSLDEEVMTDFRSRSIKSPESNQIPIVIWARLLMDLEPYLMERKAFSTVMLDFYHTQENEVIKKEILSKDNMQMIYRVMSLYFSSLGSKMNFKKGSDWLNDNWYKAKRINEELIFQLYEAKEYKLVRKLILNGDAPYVDTPDEILQWGFVATPLDPWPVPPGSWCSADILDEFERKAGFPILWHCRNCGHEGHDWNLPDKCPSCKYQGDPALKALFVKLRASESLEKDQFFSELCTYIQYELLNRNKPEFSYQQIQQQLLEFKKQESEGLNEKAQLLARELAIKDIEMARLEKQWVKAQAEGITYNVPGEKWFEFYRSYRYGHSVYCLRCGAWDEDEGPPPDACPKCGWE